MRIRGLIDTIINLTSGFDMKNLLLLTTALTVGMSLPAKADPAIGFGISFAFGGSGGGVETGLGVRLTSDDEKDSAVATVGIDYMFQSQRWRPTVGVAYLGDNMYVGLDLGFGLNGEGLDFGVGVGAIDTKDKAVAPATTVPGSTVIPQPTTTIVSPP